MTTRNVLVPVTSAIMVACIVTSLVALSYTLGSTRQSDYLVLLAALVAVEAYFSARMHGSFRLYVIELGIIYAVLVAADTAANGGTLRDAITPRFNEPILFSSVLLLFVWLGVREMAEMLPEIDKSTEPSKVVGALALRFGAGGVFLFFIAGLSQRSLASALDLPPKAASGPLLNVLVYFLLGMLLLSYLQHQALQRRWAIQQVRIDGDMQSSWLRLTAGLLLAALLVAVILPTTQVFGVTGIFGAIWHAISGIGLGLWSHLPGKAAIPPLGKVLGHPGHHLPPRVPPHTAHGPTPPTWLNAARTAVFWVVLVAGALYMISRVQLSARPKGRKISLGGRLARFWKRLWRGLRRGTRRAAALLPRTLPRRVGRAPAPVRRRFLRLNALSPQEQVRYFYLSLVRRAQESGIARDPSQTPREFAGWLTSRVGDAEPDLRGLTEAFVEARYSGRHIDRERVNPVKAQWRRVRAALRP